MAAVISIVIDDSTNKIITGSYEFDRAGGGTLLIPSGSAFPTDPAPAAKELFWRSDESKLYRRNDANTSWVVVVASPAAHASSHQPGGSDAMAVDAVAGTGSLRTLGTSATAACAGNDSRLSDARAPTAHKTSHEPGGSDALTVDAAAGTGSLRTLGTGATAACAGNDSRLSDARTPAAHKTSHEPGGSDALAVDAAAGTGSLRTLGTGATAACAGNDSRLSDSRTPTAHATSHKNGGSDEVATATAAANAIPKAAAGGKLDIGWVPLGATSTTVCVGNDSRLSDARTPTAHASSHQPGGGDAMAVDAAAGTGSLRTLGTAATSACAGNDSRLSDARTPTAHATSHKSGGSDAIKLDELAAPTDITTLNADLTKHGLLPKLGGGTTNYLRADGTWATPPGGGGTDPDAIHDNVSGEIAAITAKTIPAIDDLVIIEDSAASNAKKKMTVGSLLAGERNYFLGEASFFDDFWPPVLDDQWSTAASGTGSLVALQTLPGGQVLIRAGNAAGRTAELYFGGSTVWQSLTLNPRLKARMKYGGNNNGHIEFEVHYQDANNHVWMEADWGGNWLLKTASGGVSTTVNTGVALDTSWHIFEVRTSPTSVSAYIDEVLKATITTNIPSSNGTVSIYVSATGTGGVKDLLVDGFNYAGSRPT